MIKYSNNGISTRVCTVMIYLPRVMQHNRKTCQTSNKQCISETVMTSEAREQFDAFVVTRLQFTQRSSLKVRP